MSSTPDPTTAPPGAEGPARGEMRIITRAAAVLRALAERPAGSSLGQLARATGLPRSTVQRLVGALAAERLVSADGIVPGVRLGAEVARLAAAVHRDVTQVFRPHLERLHAEIEDTVDLTMLQGNAAVVVDQVASGRALRVVSHLGTALPLHCTASGKAHLSQLDDALAAALLGRMLQRYTSHSLTDPRAVLALLDPGGERVSIDREEFAVGVCAIALPVRGLNAGNFAVAVSMPKQHFAEHFEAARLALDRCRIGLERVAGVGTP